MQLLWLHILRHIYIFRQILNNKTGLNTKNEMLQKAVDCSLSWEEIEKEKRDIIMKLNNTR